MQKFDIFMTGFASVLTGVGSCLVMFCEAIFEAFGKPSSNAPPASTNIDYFDGFRKDRDALASDWGKIGDDFRRAIDEYVETHEGKTNPIN